MTTILRTFYTFMLRWLEFELILARSVSTNMPHINQLETEVHEYERLLFQLELRETS